MSENQICNIYIHSIYASINILVLYTDGASSPNHGRAGAENWP